MRIFQVIASLVLVSLLLSFQMQPDKKQIEKGQKLAKTCIHCHGTTKRKDFAFPLQRIRLYRNEEWIMGMVKNASAFMARNPAAAAQFSGKPIMSAFPQFSKDDIYAIFDYLDSLPYNPENYKHRKGWKTL